MSTFLQSEFNALLTRYTLDQSCIQSYWMEIEHQYGGADRDYHNLAHLENMMVVLQAIQTEINDWDVLLFAVFYHDIVYCATSTDNEEQSAQIAKARLTSLNFPKSRIQRVFDQILASKQHSEAMDRDTNFFLDADLSILGKDWPEYNNYCQSIRKEYAIYPDDAYRIGRKKALTSLLDFNTIFKTPYFQAKFENQARLNIEKELHSL